MNSDNNKSMIISKILSANDTGETGTHQAGMLVPKSNEILGFFPKLTTEIKNPRVKLRFLDGSNCAWDFMFIYYNNKYFSGTRNEFRLTGMTAFIRENNLKTGDKIILSKDVNNERTISYERVKEISENPVLKLNNSWKVIKI